MADDAKQDDAEKAYAAAATDLSPARKPEISPPAASVEPAKVQPKAKVEAAKPLPTASAPAVKKLPARKVAKAKLVKVKAAKITPPRAVAEKAPAATSVPTRKPVRQAPVASTQPVPTLNQLKETIMATVKTTDFTQAADYSQPMADAFGEMQNRAKAAYEKSTVALSDVTDFAKGNVEAVVESGKILAAGVQDLGRAYVEEAKTAYETATADVKELAAVKSPTELFQLQGKIARRNFDAMFATSSKNTDALIKLASDAFAPLSGRVNLATEKLAKVA